MRWHLIALATLSACSRSQPTALPEQPVAVSNAPSREAQDEVKALASRADAALDTDTPLDFERPVVAKPLDRAETRALFVDACRHGDHASCWKAMYVARDVASLSDPKPESLDLVARNCEGGDVSSCRALPEATFRDLPGAHGRSPECEPLRDECDIAALRRECNDGFPRSCRLLATGNRAAGEAEELIRRTNELARKGCASDILTDCELVTNWSDEDLMQTLRRRCRFDRNKCDNLASLLERKTKSAAVRDLREVACQHSDAIHACVTLGVGYLDGKYPEPERGRGQRLLDYACAIYRKQSAGNPKSVDDRVPACKRASK
jgi:hypothetical protein